MKNKILSFLLLVAMIIALLPTGTVVMAADADTATVFEVANGTDFLNAITQINNADSGEFIIKLTDNIELTKEAKLTKNITTILGQGNTIFGAHSSARIYVCGDVAAPWGDIVLNLGSSDSSDSLTIKGTKADGTAVSSGGSALVQCQYATLNMYEGVIVSNATGTGYGAGLLITGNFNMYGGSITQNTTKHYYGGAGVALTSGTMNMYGGSITENQWNGSFGLGHGGGIIVFPDYKYSECIFNMYGGTISGNEAKKGGGISAGAYMNGYTPCTTALNFYGGKIVDNKASVLGGGVYISEGYSEETKELNIYTTIDPKVALPVDVATILGVSDAKDGDSVIIIGNTNVSTNTADNLAIDADLIPGTIPEVTYDKITIGDLTSTDTKIGITMQYVPPEDYPEYIVPSITDTAFTANYRLNNFGTHPAAYFSSDNSDYVIADWYADGNEEPSEVRLAEYIPVTFKVENGTWADYTTTDIIVPAILPQGSSEGAGATLSSAYIPTGMLAASGFSGGDWDKEIKITDGAVTEEVTYTYTFTEQSYIVWVGGQGMTASEDGEVVSYYTNGADGAAGTVSQTQPDEYHARLYYDTAAEVYTLELNGLNATGIANDADSYGAGIYSTVPLVVNVSGYNSVNGAAGTGDVYGVYSKELTINGTENDTLYITTQGSTSDNYGIYSEGNVIINGGTVTASVKFENIGAGIDTRNCLNFGISAGNNLNITDGELNAYSEENGLNTNYAVYVKKDLTISGGSLTAAGAPAGTFSYGIYCNNLTINDGAQVTAASDTAEYLSYGTFVYGNFYMSDNNSALTTSSGVVESNTSRYVNRSAGLYLGDDRYEDDFIIDDTFTITGGTLKAWCDSSDSQNAKEAVAVGLLDVVDDKFVFSDANQSNDKWYEWTLQSDENGAPVSKIMSTDKVYVHNDTDENWKSSYLYIAPVVIKHTVTYALNGGTGADGVDYSTQTVTDGTEITVKEAPTKSGYTFNGYSDGTSAYNPGDKIIVNADITLTAQWTQNSQQGGGGSTPRGNVVLTKVDANDSSTLISNVEFKLYRANGTLAGTYTTDENGKITVNRLQTGKYYWQETRPAEGYTLDDTKHEFEIVRNKTTEVTVTNSRTGVPSMFRDEHYAYIVGYPDGLIRPEANITRAEVATIFFRLLNDETRTQYMAKDNSFSDVKADAWYNTAVSTVAKMGIVKGYPDGEFKPDENITRAEFAAIAARFDEKSAGTDKASFADIVNHWAENEINKAVSNGWVLGYEDGTFRPGKSITRAETMTLVNRVLQRIPEDKEDLLTGMTEWPDNANKEAWYYLAVQEATNSHEYSRKANGYEKWTELTEAFDWAELEK